MERQQPKIADYFWKVEHKTGWRVLGKAKDGNPYVLGSGMTDPDADELLIRIKTVALSYGRQLVVRKSTRTLAPNEAQRFWSPGLDLARYMMPNDVVRVVNEESTQKFIIQVLVGKTWTFVCSS